MENASKALIMAGGVLLGVLLISLAVYLFSSYAEYSSNAYERMEAAQIEQFNTQFLKYYNPAAATDSSLAIKCTAHDIISLANLAKQNNKDMEIADEYR